MTDWLTRMLAPRPVFAPEGEGAGGGGGGEGEGNSGDGGDTGAGGDTGDGIATADDQKQDQGDGEADGDGTVLNGEGADGEDEGGENGSKDGADGEEDGEGEGAPEEYDFSDVLPDGVELDTTMNEAMSPAMRELGLTQEQANGLVKAYIDGQTKAAEAQAAEVGRVMKEWVSTAKADKEIGHNNWDDSVRHANAVLKEFGTPELVQDVMVGQGVGNHPEVIRVFARIGKAIADDSTPSGQSTDTTQRSEEERWYGGTTPTSKKG